MNEICFAGVLVWRGVNSQGYREYKRSKDGATVILIPAGHFVQGTTDEDATIIERSVPWYKASRVECPQSTIWTEAFLIDRCEVTNQQFANFLNAIDTRTCFDPKLNGTLAACNAADTTVLCYDALDFVAKRGIPNSAHDVGICYDGHEWQPTPEGESCPVVLVTWEGAYQYAQWVGFALPSEAQWEKASRGADARNFPWGDQYEPKFANTADRWLGSRIMAQSMWDEVFYQNGSGKAWLASRPLPVESFPQGASPYGCQDMVGNVAEWCSTWYDEDAYAMQGKDKDIVFGEIQTSGLKCMRGSGRYGYEAIARCSCRRRRDPQSASENLGFRCALTLPQNAAERLMNMNDAGPHP